MDAVQPDPQDLRDDVEGHILTRPVEGGEPEGFRAAFAHDEQADGFKAKADGFKAKADGDDVEGHVLDRKADSES